MELLRHKATKVTKKVEELFSIPWQLFTGIQTADLLDRKPARYFGTTLTSLAEPVLILAPTRECCL
jgi:hypothetical protein